MADTIREFVASLGFELDESTQRRFTTALEGATLRAKLLGDALESMARTIASSVADVAGNFEQLFYLSKQTGSPIADIRALQFAFENVGGSAEEATATIKSFGSALRDNPKGLTALAQNLGVQTKDAFGKSISEARFLLNLGDRLAKMPFNQAKAFAGTFGVDEHALLMLESGVKLREKFNESLTSDQAAGIDDAAAARATKFEQTWRDVWKSIGAMSEGGQSKLFDGLTKPMADFNDWLKQHEPEIDKSIGKIATSFDTLATQWTIDASKLVFGDDQVKGIDDAATVISKFVDSMVPFIRELEDFNTKSKEWWFIKLIDRTTSGDDSLFGGGIVGHEADPEGHSADVWGAVKGWWSSHAPTWAGGSSSAGGGNKGVGGWWTPERMAHAADRLEKEAGLSPMGAAGLVARWAAVEAAGGPTSRNPSSGAEGINQALGDRKPPGYAGMSFDQQLDYIIQRDLRDPAQSRSYDVLKNAQTAARAAAGASMYERAEGFNGVTDNFTGSTPVQSVYDRIHRAAAAGVGASTPQLYAPTTGTGMGYPAVDPSSLFAPVPGADGTWGGGDKTVTSTVTNNINVSSPDPGAAAAAVGLHLDRTSADVSRNLQGAVQ